MRLFVPYTKINLKTYDSLRSYEYTPVKMVADDDYLHYFIKRWKNVESFINCEHDTVFWNGAVEDLERCPEEWCAFGVPSIDTQWGQDSGESTSTEPYEKQFTDGIVATLALVKFSAGFIETHPDVWEMMANATDVRWAQQPKWMWCDLWLDHYARSQGVVCHQHYPNVLNYKGT